MKTRSDLYSREAAELLRLITMYPGILELQLIRFFPGKETKIKNLLSHLKKQGRILLRENGSYSAPDVGPDLRHGDMEKAVWVLLDFADKAEFHSVSEFPVKIMFFADGELYEIIQVPAGSEILITQALPKIREHCGRRIVLVDEPEQIPLLDFPGIAGFCTTDKAGQVHYYKRMNGGL